MTRSLVMAACALLPASLSPSTLIFDLNGVLIDVDRNSMAKEIGGGRYSDFIKYALFDRKNPLDLKDRMLDVLEAHEGLPSPLLFPSEELPRAEGRVMPLCMCKWMTGDVTGPQLLADLQPTLTRLDASGWFTSSRERELIERILSCTFDPQILGKYTRPIKRGSALLRSARAMIDAQGGTKHRIVILSNFDVETFKILYTPGHPVFEEVLRFVDPEDIIISASINRMKPHRTIFEYVLNKYGIVDPAECVFIDDQEENIAAAQSCGITAVQIKNGVYTKAQAVVRSALEKEYAYKPAEHTDF